jgi:hypothetical protein
MCISCMPNELKEDEMSELLSEYSEQSFLANKKKYRSRYVKKAD